MKFLLLFIISSVCLLAEIAKVSAVVGDAKIVRGNETIIVKLGSLIEEKDIIETKKNSKVQIIFKDNTIVTLGKSSALNINEYLFDLKNPNKSKTDLNFFKGAFKTITGKIGKINKKKFKLRTKSSTIGIRGTVLLGNETTVLCIQGEISVAANGQEVIVPANNVTTVKNGNLTPPTEYTTQTLQTLTNSLEPDDNDSADDANTNSDSSSSNSSGESGDSDSSTKDSNDSNSSSQSDSSDSESNDSNSNDSDSNSSDSSSSSSSSSSSADSSDSNISQEDSSIAATGDGTSSSTNDSTTSSAASTTTTTSTDTSLTQAAQNASDDSNEKEVASQVTTLSLQGHALGGYVEGSTSSTNSYSQKDTSFTAKRVDKTISFDETLKRKYSGSSTEEDIQINKSKEFTSLGTPKSGGYTGKTELGTIDFSYSSNGGITNSGNYNVVSDNMGEFFVLYHKNSQSTTTGFNEVIVFGKKGDLSTADKTKIYVYKDFVSMRVQKDSSGNFTETKLDTTDGGYEYYNPHLNSMTHLNSDYYQNGAEEFISGTNSKIKVNRNKYNFTYSSNALNMSSYNYGSTTADIAVMGTDLQGVSYNLSTTSNTKNFSTDTTTISSSENSGASFLEKDLMTTAKTTGELDMKGFIVAESFQDVDTSKTLRKSSSDFNLKVNRSTGKITGSSNIGEVTNRPLNGMSLAFNGEIASDTSYYINDDIFGVKFAKGDSVFKLGTEDHQLSDDSGYLIAVPDGAIDNGAFKFFDANDNPIMSDDDSSWGYWTAKFDTSSTASNNIFVSPYSTWVAGIQTPASVIDGLISNQTSTTYSFEGGVIGSVLTSSGAVESIKVDNNNLVKMNFDIGGGNRALTGGSIKFSSNSTSWNMQLTNKSLETTGALIEQKGFTTDMSGNITIGTNSSNVSGSIEGKFYGQDKLKSVGGTFNASSQNAAGTVDYAAQGVFKAIKK